MFRSRRLLVQIRLRLEQPFVARTASKLQHFAASFSTESSARSRFGDDGTDRMDGEADADADELSPATLKRMVQPFILKCHPDMAKQHNLSDAARDINLGAIQNLNSYMDASVRLHQKPSAAFPFDAKQSVVEIDFVLALSGGRSASSGTLKRSKKASSSDPATTRRMVELAIPPPSLPTDDVLFHARAQFVKLLRIAGLPIRPEWEEQRYRTGPDGSIDVDGDLFGSGSSSGDEWMDEAAYRNDLNRHMEQRRPKTKWEHSRDRFKARIDWNKFDQAYNAAIRDMEADIQMTGKVRNSPQLRRAMIAKVLSNIQVAQGTDVEIVPLERLVAYRRILRLLDDQFDELQLEEMGRYWEELKIVLHPSRTYNISSSALRKRTLRNMDTGFCFKIHSDDSVSIDMPVDFQDDEFLQELDRNVQDFHSFLRKQYDTPEFFK